jgi:hypothetical protein
MMSDDRHRSPAHYRAQARKLRTMAEEETAMELREKLLDLARSYEQLAMMRERAGKR